MESAAMPLSPRGVLERTVEVLRMVKVEHSIFALPFAFLGMILAARGLPSWQTVGWIALCLVAARCSAMSFNRILDRSYDARNPRTADRSLPAGRLSVAFAWGFTLLTAGLFIFGAGMLNRTCLLLSLPALVLILGYSVLKRFTAATHFVLGLALSLAPAGAWIAVRGDLGLEPVLLSLAVAAWVAGFDILYACQDIEFDRREGLHSLAARWGARNALRVAAVLHVLMLGLLGGLALVSPLGWIYGLGVLAAAGLLAYAHGIVRPEDLSRVQTAFFTTNAWLGPVLLVATWADLAWNAG